MIGKRAGLVAIAACAVLGGSTARAADPSVSGNWAGYAVTASASSSAFSSVTGSWIVPGVSCTDAAPSFTAFWVGLGGFATDAQTLEQIGTETDCSATGDASWFAWYELVPAPPVRVKLEVAAGDKVAAAVKVSGTRVSLVVRNLTRHTSFSKRVRVASPDRSSAEWIVESPSACSPYRGCRPLPLANFHTVSFSDALATARGHRGTISDPAWSATAIQLDSAAPGIADFGRGSWRWRGNLPDSPLAGAIPSAFSPDGSSFSVSWRQQGLSTPPQGQPQPAGPYAP